MNGWDELDLGQVRVRGKQVGVPGARGSESNEDPQEVRMGGNKVSREE